MPIITPKRPNALAKISTTKIFTNKVEFAASARAAALPTTPTLNPHAKLAQPVTEPAPRMAKPAFAAAREYEPSSFGLTASTLVCKIIETITP